MMRAALLACAVLVMASDAFAGTGGTAPGAGAGARLQGSWTMNGKVTRADNVRGERKGQKLKRTWAFTSSCTSGPCSTVLLRRERSSKQFDKLTLKRSGSTYSGSGKFYVRLKCNGRTYNRGGIAYYAIRVTPTKSRTVQGTQFATAVKATYNNTKRVNKTPCAGSIGRDGGSYTGKLTSAFPAAPAAAFEFASDATTPGLVHFDDQSTRAKDARFVSWNWDFGDGAKSSAKNPSHQYAPGTYHVTLTVRDTNGLTGTITKDVTI
jgi:PKD repeat protein